MAKLLVGQVVKPFYFGVSRLHPIDDLLQVLQPFGCDFVQCLVGKGAGDDYKTDAAVGADVCYGGQVIGEFLLPCLDEVVIVAPVGVSLQRRIAQRIGCQPPPPRARHSS